MIQLCWAKPKAKAKAKPQAKATAKPKAKPKPKPKAKAKAKAKDLLFLSTNCFLAIVYFLQYTLTPLKLRLLEYYQDITYTIELYDCIH